MGRRLHEHDVRALNIAVQGDVFAIAIATHVLIADAQLQRFFAIKLVGQGIILNHELSVFAGCLREPLIELQRRKPLLDALLIDQREQPLLVQRRRTVCWE